MTATPTPTVVRCRHGRDKSDPAVRAEYRYGFIASFALLSGYTALPKRIDFICPDCGTVVGSITDRPTLKKFRFHEPRPHER